MKPDTTQTKGWPRLARGWALSLAAWVLLVGTQASSRAGEDALYGPTAPPDSAFIRVFNATDQAEVDARIADAELTDIASWKVSEFAFVPAGTHKLIVGALSQPLALQADHYYTAVANAGTVRLLDNTRYVNRLKAMVILYNLTDASRLSLRTHDGRAPVIQNVAAYAFGTREVNPARAQLVVYDGEQKIADAPTMTFARGKAYSLFVAGGSGKPRLVWAIN